MAKFFRRGVSAIKFLPSVAGASPTRGEITAGTILTPQVADISGFQLSNQPIPVPDLSTVFTSQINGEDTVADSSITFNDDDASTTIRTALAKGTAGFVILFPYGDLVGKRLEKWPVVSTGVNDAWSVGNDPAQFVVGFAVTSTPVQSGTTPA
jgi:hypothetical protein